MDSQSLIPQGPNKLLTPPHSQPFPSDEVSFFGFAFSFFFNITVFKAFLRFNEWSVFLDFLDVVSLFPKLVAPLL
jgi:hypothetical protein